MPSSPARFAGAWTPDARAAVEEAIVYYESTRPDPPSALDGRPWIVAAHQLADGLYLVAHRHDHQTSLTAHSVEDLVEAIRRRADRSQGA